MKLFIGLVDNGINLPLKMNFVPKENLDNKSNVNVISASLVISWLGLVQMLFKMATLAVDLQHGAASSILFWHLFFIFRLVIRELALIFEWNFDFELRLERTTGFGWC